MLETIKRLVEQPTQHADVRCTIHNRGLRFVVETHPVRGKSGVSIQHVDWRLLDAAPSGLAANTILEEAYAKAVADADQLVSQGQTVRLFGGPNDGQYVPWRGESEIKVTETRQEQGMGFVNKLRPPRDGSYKRGRSGEFHWQGWEKSNG